MIYKSHDLNLGLHTIKLTCDVRKGKGVCGTEASILYAEPEDFPLKGALIEVGMALAFGIPVGLVLPGVNLEEGSMRPVGSWMHHPQCYRFESIDSALLSLLQSGRGTK